MVSDDDRTRLRRLSNQTNITVGLVANLFDAAALLTADTLGWARVPASHAAAVAAISAGFYAIFTALNLRQRRLDRAFGERFYWGAMMCQIPVFAVGTLIADAVRPAMLMFSTALLGLLFVRADQRQAMAYGAALALSYLLASALSPWLVGATPRFGEDVFYLVTWLPSLALVVYLVGQQHGVRARLRRQRRQIDRFTEQRLELLRRVSDEIRHPLGLVVDPLDRLLRTGPASPQLQRILRRVRRLARRVDRLLDVEESGTGPSSAPADPDQQPTVKLDRAPDGALDDADRYLLVVQPDRGLRTSVVRVLAAAGHPVRSVDDAAEALRLARSRPPALVVADWRMPGMSGPDLIRGIREDPSLRTVPTVLLTARADPASRIAGVKAGADAFIGKPFDPEELTSTVRNLLRLGDREQEVQELVRRLREEVFGRFLPPALVDDVVEGRTSLDQAPVTLPITTLVVDVVDFTRLTQRLRASGVAAYVSDLLRIVTEVVAEHDGFVDKFLGDGALVHFGVPVRVPTDTQARRAAECAAALHLRVRALDATWRARGVGATRLRIGIHQGPAAVGYLGTPRRTEYTAIGPSVNLAFRIQGSCRPGATFVSAVVADFLEPAAIESVGTVDLGDLRGETQLYALRPALADGVTTAGAPADAMGVLLAVGDVVGPYRVVGWLGRGAMAVVYEVVHEVLERRSAMKVLLADRADLVQRTVAEGRIQARLQSPNVLPVLDVQQVGGRPALVMPLVDGGSLADLLTRHAPTPEEAIALGLGIARGLAAVHEAGIVHRDLKPANVLLDVHHGVVVPRVGDFGLAREPRRGSRHDTVAGQFLGTPVYAAPEQFDDASRVGAAADVWALGAVLFELLTGQSAFVEGPFSLVREQVEAASYDERRVPALWRALVKRMLDVDPDARPAAHDVCAALAPVAAESALATAELVARVRGDERV